MEKINISQTIIHLKFIIFSKILQKYLYRKSLSRYFEDSSSTLFLVSII